MTSLLLVLLLAGCKSAPAGRPVDALELIDDQSSFYIAVPREADNVLIERIISGFYKDASQEDAKMIADRVTKVYCGLNRSRHGTEVQASVEGNIPKKYLPKLLSAKNGWVSSDYTPDKSLNSSSFTSIVFLSTNPFTLSIILPSTRLTIYLLRCASKTLSLI